MVVVLLKLACQPSEVLVIYSVHLVE